MRNNIDKETYTWSFKVFALLGILLLLVNIFLYFSLEKLSFTLNMLSEKQI